MLEETAHIAILRVGLFFSLPQSLKAKRSILKSVKDQIRNHFNVSVAELGHHDKWQRSILGVSVIGCDRPHLDQSLQRVLKFIRERRDLEVTESEIEFI